MVNKKFKQFSPNMLKTYELCPKKFYFQYVKNISMPVNDDVFEFGKNIHALASYYLKKENIDRMEKALSNKEQSVWNYLKGIEYFSYDFVNTEYNLSVKIQDYFFGGRIDAIVKKDNNYYILDYKTGAVPKNPKYDFQTIIYTLAVKHFFKTDNIHFVYIDLKNKSEIKISYKKELQEDYEKKLILTAEKIEKLDYPQKKSDCGCEYSSICF